VRLGFIHRLYPKVAGCEPEANGNFSVREDWKSEVMLTVSDEHCKVPSKQMASSGH